MSAAFSSLALLFVVFASPSGLISRQHFDRARHLFAQHDYRRALDEFTAAEESAPNEVPDLWFDIGQCHRNLGHPRQAVAAFERYLALVPDAADRAKVEALVVQMGGRVEEPSVEPSVAEPAPPPAPIPAAPAAVAPAASVGASAEPAAPPALEPQAVAIGSAAVTPVADPLLASRPPKPRRRWVAWTAGAGAVAVTAVALGLGLGLGLGHGGSLPSLGNAGTFDTRSH